MREIILETLGLSKQYGSVAAVSNVNLQVNRAEVYGFLGPNGAGKTTTIGMALGLLHPTSGRIELFGQHMSPARTQPLRQVGSMIGRPALIPYLSGRQNLRLLARLHSDVDEQRIEEVLELVGMSQAAERKTKSYSTGMKQRLALAAALLHRPSLVILDEPTNGLDPAGMREVRNLLRSLADSGVTVFLSSHLLYEVEQICDRIAVISKGCIVSQGLVADLLSKQGHLVKVRVPSPAAASKALQSLPGVGQVKTNGVYVQITGVTSETVVAFLTSQGIVPGEVLVQQSDLETLFLELTQD